MNGHNDKSGGLAVMRPMMRQRIFLWMLALAVGGALLPLGWAASLRICAACGHEALHEGPVCTHCGAALPPLPEAVPPEPAGEPPAPGPDRAPADPAPVLPPGAAAAEVRWAQRLFDAGELWGAHLAARNAAAMAALQDADGADTLAAASALRNESRRRLFVVRRVCPVCEGAGTQSINVVTLRGEVIEQELRAQPCAACGGVGAWNARPVLAELSREEAVARRAFSVEQLRRGRRESQGIWLPRDLADGLEVRSTAAVRKAHGVDCTACLGFGALGCTQCAGAGKIRCTNRDCLHGTEICPDCRGAGRSRTGAVTRLCDTCQGSGKRECPTCEGKGFLVCARCEGRGESLCATCRGTGASAECVRCGGQGFSACTRCSGTGEQRGQPCASCGGAGHILCTNCQGFGRLLRRR